MNYEVFFFQGRNTQIEILLPLDSDHLQHGHYVGLAEQHTNPQPLYYREMFAVLKRCRIDSGRHYEGKPIIVHVVEKEHWNAWYQNNQPQFTWHWCSDNLLRVRLPDYSLAINRAIFLYIYRKDDDNDC